jgi:acyl-coenzyme A thioesterase PaaI-like protein
MRPMATVSQNISFMRAISGAPGQHVEVLARVLKTGKTLAFGEVEIRAGGDAPVAVHATTTYALMG